MGVDYDGGMLVGCHGSDFSVSEDYPEHYLSEIVLDEGESLEDVENYEILEGLGLARYGEHYDASIEHSNIGFSVPNITINDPKFLEWQEEVLKLSIKFEEITGVKAKLIGCQDIW